MFTTVCEYTIRALVRLAREQGEGPVQVKVIAAKEDIPRHFLAKILNQLTYRGLVKAFRGPGGGFILSRQADTISVLEVVDAVDGPDVRHTCLLGLPGCGEENHCPLHDTWERARSQFLAEIGRTSIQALADASAAMPTLPKPGDADCPPKAAGTG